MRRRRSSRAEITGYVMAVAGAAVMLAEGAPLVKLAMTTVLVGVLVAGFSRLEQRSKASDETYRLGYDIGHEDGYVKRDQELAAVRDIVVPLRKTGDSQAPSHPSRMSDRG